MAEKMTFMKLKVDLECEKCYRKVKKLLSKYPREIREQKFDEKQNIVFITVVCCSPEKIRDKLCCNGGGSIKSIEIVEPPKAKPPVPEKKKESEKPKPAPEPEKKKKSEKPKPAPEPEKKKESKKPKPAPEPEKKKKSEKPKPAPEPEKKKKSEKPKPAPEPEKKKKAEKPKSHPRNYFFGFVIEIY